MRAKVTDAMFLRTAFALVFAAIGAMAAVSVTRLLRSWRVWDMSSAATTIASLGSASIFGALLFHLPLVGPPDEAVALSRTRRRVLLVAVPVLLVMMGSGLVMVIGGRSMKLVQTMTFPGVLGSMFLAHGAGAAIVVELMRQTIQRTSPWTDRRHLTGVGILWSLFSGVGAALLWREWQRL